MARIRSIKPEFPQSESMGAISREARLCFILLWTISDDEGRLRAASRMLASLLYPYDNDAAELIDGWLEELEREECIQRYKVDGQSYIQIHNWLSHQKIDHPSPSKFPQFAKPRESSRRSRESSRGIGLDRKGEEGIGKEKKEASQATPPPEEAMALSSLLFSLHREGIDPGFSATPAQLEAWAWDIEKLHRLNGRAWPDIEAAIRWAKAPGCFWGPNIISGKKLREKYPTIVGQMNRPAGPAPKVLTQGTMLEMGA